MAEDGVSVCVMLSVGHEGNRGLLKEMTVAKTVWDYDEAKKHFGKLAKCARAQGLQTISEKGKPPLVLMTVEEFEKLASKGLTVPKEEQETDGLLVLLQQCPAPELADIINQTRPKSHGRDLTF